MENEIKELSKYAELDGTELGKACEFLIALLNRSDYLSNNFEKLLEKEITDQLTEFKKKLRNNN